MVQWLRICLLMQGTQFDATCHRATKPVHHSHWARQEKGRKVNMTGIERQISLGPNLGHPMAEPLSPALLASSYLCISFSLLFLPQVWWILLLQESWTFPLKIWPCCSRCLSFRGYPSFPSTLTSYCCPLGNNIYPFKTCTPVFLAAFIMTAKSGNDSKVH